MDTNIRVRTNALKNVDWSLYSSTVILEVKRSGKTFTSTAVAIGDSVLITAAHSVDGMDSASICIGRSYKDSQGKISVSECYIHPDYNAKDSLFKNDIAVIFLEEELPISVKAEDIPKSLNLRIGQHVDRIGFGSRESENRRTWTNPTYKGLSEEGKCLVLEDLNSVIGDSGGPVFSNVDGVVKLVGIHSTLEGTSKTYVVNLAYYFDWINEVLTLN